MTVVAAGVVAAGTITAGIIASNAAKKKAQALEAEARRLGAKMNQIEENRQDIINPYEGMTDLSGMMSNPFASLGVATSAAEMKIEQADISLANTLDMIRTTGGGSGSATALAQAALQSKKGVAASIEMQEAQNNKLRVQGEQTLQQQKLSEQKRLQQADVAGQQFMFAAQEDRDMQQLNRLSNQIGALRGQASAQNAAGTAALTGAISSGMGTLGAGISAQGD